MWVQEEHGDGSLQASNLLKELLVPFSEGQSWQRVLWLCPMVMPEASSETLQGGLPPPCSS